MNISVKKISQDSQPVAQSVRETTEKAVSQQSVQQPFIDDAASVKTEILTTTDIEIRKLHALRRAKEYLEEQLSRAGAEQLKSVSGFEIAESNAAAREYSARANAVSSGREIVTEVKPPEGDFSTCASFKTGAAISGYRTYKKDTPKAWADGDIDEKR